MPWRSLLFLSPVVLLAGQMPAGSQVRDELDAMAPLQPRPPAAFQPGRPVLMSGFSCRAEWITPQNPVGYEYQRGGIKGSDHWARRGFFEDGDAAAWILPLAEENIRWMGQINAQGVVFWNTAVNPLGGNLNYIPESNWFHPEIEKRLTVEKSVHEDWLVSTAELRASNRVVLARSTNVALRVANAEQRVEFRRSDLTLEGLGLTNRLAWNRRGDAFAVPVTNAEPRLTGLAAGAAVSLDARLRELPGTTLALAVQRVERPAINAFVQRIHEAGFETGFINRGDFSCGVPWRQVDVSFDWEGEWQYRMFAARFADYRDRFGPRCRWFYIDSFGGSEPPDVYRRMRLDFPNLFMGAEHEYDMTHRLLGTCYDHHAPSALHLMINPHLVTLVRINRDWISVEETARTVVGNPHVIPLVQPHTIADWLAAVELARAPPQPWRGIQGAAPLPAPACRGEAKRRRASRGSAAAPPRMTHRLRCSVSQSRRGREGAAPLPAPACRGEAKTGRPRKRGRSPMYDSYETSAAVGFFRVSGS